MRGVVCVYLCACVVVGVCHVTSVAINSGVWIHQLCSVCPETTQQPYKMASHAATLLAFFLNVHKLRGGILLAFLRIFVQVFYDYGE